MVDVPEGSRPLKDSERAVRSGSRLIGPSDPDEILSITVRLRRNPDAPALPDMTSPNAEPMAPEAFARTFGASDNDLQTVASFLSTNGLQVTERNSARRTIVATGTAAQMSKVFGVELGLYKSQTETYRGREGPLHLPTNLHGIVEGVFGLDNRRMAARSMARAAAARAGAARPLTPPEVAELYQFPTPLSAQGQTIGLLEFGGGYIPSDIEAFFDGLNMAAPRLTPVSVNGATNSPGSLQRPNDADAEVALDIDVAGSVAAGAEIAVYFTTFDENGWVQAVTTALYPDPGQPAPSVLSISWGWPELETVPQTNNFAWSKAAILAVSATFQEAAAQGVTVFAASGDHGSSCGLPGGIAHALYPGSDPWVTSCGGTLITDVSGGSFTETTWQDNNGWATGGGVSDVFVPGPPWQAQTNTPSSLNDHHNGRTIPDVAGNADNASGYEITTYGQSGSVGGTSAVAPLYAAMAAIMNAKLGKRIGFLNPILYSDPTLCRDVADRQTNATYGAPGYASTPGYDACTGWGSIIGAKLIAKF